MSTGSKTIADLPEVTSLKGEDQFLFFENTTKKTKKVSRKNMFNSEGIIVKGKFISPEGNDVGLTAATAFSNALIAQADASGAQASANGKNRIFYQNDAPSNPFGSPAYDLILNDLWYEIDNGYKMYKWSGSTWDAYELGNAALQSLDVGKLTSGFISSKVIELSDSTAYFQSSTFVESWVSGKLYKTIKSSPSDTIKVKVLQSNGSFKVYNCNTEHTSSGASFPGPDSGKWTEVSVPTISVDIGGGSKSIPDFGFRIVGNGQAEFGGAVFRGAVIAQEGFFGTTKNAARIDDNGLIIGDDGRIKSAGIGYNGTNFTSTSGSGGYFLGNTQGEGQDDYFQFFIGNPSGNNLIWNGTVLKINGNIVGGSTVGTNSNDVGLVMNTQFGIRRSVNNGTLTITGGNGNGITFGSQIDLVGTEFTGASGNAEGQLILSAGYDDTHTTGEESRDGCIIFRTSRESDANIGVQRLRIDLDGTVRVVDAGNANAGAPDSGAGNLIVDNSVTAGTYTSTSSKRFKKKIKNFKNGLETISKLRPVVFDWKNKEIKNDIGLIAEEVHKVIPNLVGLNNEGEVVGIDYGKLTPILIQAVKELSAEIERLKNKMHHGGARN